MTDRPAIDTLEAVRALEDSGLDPKIAEVLVRLIDDAVQNSAASSTDFCEIKLHVERSERRSVLYLGAMIVLAGAMLGIVFNFETVTDFFSKL